ncbi:hypothetical protein C2G38_2233014 [Gigaspora rosea]|uniref:Replication origin-binding protein domain-containing protein n=1 Tax=Gigaspora rosea TaxID=44941 RepID=A0A397TWL6_9GLOM|nr:hypothetical protein C2G38_2233014 [Gigaspora rosea]
MGGSRLEESRRDSSTFKHNPLKNALYPEHKGLSFDKVSDKVESEVKPKWGLNERLVNIAKHPRLLVDLSRKNINVREMKDAPEAYPNFISEEPTTTLIRSPIASGKTKTLREILDSLAKSEANLPCFNWVLYRKTLSNVTKDEANGIMRQIASGIHARESENAMRDLLKSAVHVVAMDAFANQSESVKILYDPDKGSEAIHKGLLMLQEGKRVVFSMTSCKKAQALANQTSKLQKPDGSFILTRVYFGQMDEKQRQDDFANINTTWSGLDCVIYTSIVELGISFEIPKYFDTIIAISNINTGVHAKAFTQMLYRLSALRPGDLPTLVKGHREWNKIADCYTLDSSPAVETYIEVKYQRRLSAKYFSEILCSLIGSTRATLELISAEGTKDTRIKVSNTIKGIEKGIKCSDAESIVNAPDITPYEAETLKLNPERFFADNMSLQRYYLWRTYASDFVEKFNSSEPIKHFRGLEELQDSTNPALNDLYKYYSAKQWEAVPDLFKLVGFSGIDDTRILSSDDVAKTFEQSREKIVKIREDVLLIFGFKSWAKGTPDLKATVKLINAIVENWCGYTVKTYNGCGFNNQEEVITTKLRNPEYHPIAPILPSYKPELAVETQELFDSIPITTDITISEYVEHGVTYSSSNVINEKALSLEIPAHNQTINSSQNIYHANTICEVSTGEKKIPNSIISLSSESY